MFEPDQRQFRDAALWEGRKPCGAPTVSLAEILAAFSYALDLTEGQPEGHSIRCGWIETMLAHRIGLAGPALWGVFYAATAADRALAIIGEEVGKAVDPDCYRALCSVVTGDAPLPVMPAVLARPFSG